MDLNNSALQESFAEKMRRIQLEQQKNTNPKIIENAFENIKKTIEEYVSNPNNCFSHEITFGIREVKSGVMELYDNKECTTIAMLSMSELQILDDKIRKISGLRTSGCCVDNGYLTVSWI